MGARAFGWVAAVAIAAAAIRASAQEPFSIPAMARIVSVSDVAIAPGGNALMFVSERADVAANDYRDRLWSYDLRARRLHAIGAERADYSAPAWDPTGTRFAVIAYDAASGADQLFVGAPSGSLRRVTGGKSSIVAFAWHPQGTAIAFVRRDVAAAATGSDAFEVTDNDYLATAAAQPRHIWIADLLTGSQRRLTQGAWSVADDTISWSPDGKRIAYARVPNAIHGISGRSAIYAVETATSVSQPLTGHDAHESQPLFSPDGARTLYLFPTDGNPSNAETAMTAQGGSADVDRSRALDRHVEEAAWMADGSALLLKVYDVTSGPLYVQPLEGASRRLALGPVVDATIGTQPAARDGTIAFAGTTPDRPSEVYVLASGATAPERVTNFNAATASLDMGRVTTLHWMADGFDESGVLTYPPGYRPGTRYPLVLRIHGGPTLTSVAAFDPFYQLAAARGYLVFAPNYRGSSNFGNAFERAIFNDASAGPGRDVESGIEAVERLGIADPARTCVSGWSYGGQLTSWMIGHYHTFKCAVTGAAVNDLVVDYTIADDIDASRSAFDGPPFSGENLTAWRAQSPIEYVKNVRTPLLMLGNVYDVRVPIVEQYELFHALRDNGVPVRFFAYPTGGHLPRGPVRLADAYRRWLAWFDRYLKGD